MSLEKYLLKLKKSLEKKDVCGLRVLSDSAFDEALIKENKDIVNFSVVCYALSKILLKKHYSQFHDVIIKKCLEIIDNRKDYNNVIKELEDNIKKLDQEMSWYYIDLTEKARLKLALKAYSLGYSLGKVITFTGCDPIEIRKYIGATQIHDTEFIISKEPLVRLKELSKIFGDFNE